MATNNSINGPSKITTFTSAGTWTKNLATKMVFQFVRGAGGGGGSGSQQSTTSNCAGGGGGGGGAGASA